MLRPRIIPCLLVKDKGLVKTVHFSEGKYVGDPINAVRIFNEKEADELMVLDLDATTKGTGPDYKMIENLARECRMPLAYGGGVRSLEQARRIIGLGVEKVSIGAAAVEAPEIISGIASEIGSQSIVAVLDVRKKLLGGYEVCTRNATVKTGIDPIKLASDLEKRGIGEIVINSIDHDGMMSGYDISLAKRIREVTSVPLTVLGGAGSLDDIGLLIREFGIIGAAAGSLFVFKGKYKAVLINYPDAAEKDRLIERYTSR